MAVAVRPQGAEAAAVPRAPALGRLALGGRTVLLSAEQGLGDTLQFCRYAPLVAARGGRVLVACQRPLRGVLRSLGGVAGFVTPPDDPTPTFDAHAPLMSLPGVFGKTLDDIPADVPYLRADAGLVRRWRPVVESTGGRLRVGVNWNSSDTPWGRPRSVPLDRFGALAVLPGLRLVSLQKGPGAEQARAAPFPVRVLEGLDGAAGPFMDTAAVIAALDLVVTCDTSVAHLAGALGAPVWVALPFEGDWRWLTDRDDTPWYPTMRLFRQTRPGDWEGVFGRMARELEVKFGCG